MAWVLVLGVVLAFLSPLVSLDPTALRAALWASMLIAWMAAAAVLVAALCPPIPTLQYLPCAHPALRPANEIIALTCARLCQILLCVLLMRSM